MKTIRNKANRPMRVPLPQKRTLHLGPNREGQISDRAVEHPPVKALVEAGEIEVVDDRRGGEPRAGEGESGVRPETHGHRQGKVAHTKKADS